MSKHALYGPAITTSSCIKPRIKDPTFGFDPTLSARDAPFKVCQRKRERGVKFLSAFREWDEKNTDSAPPCSPPPGTSTPAPCSSPACWSSTSPASPGPGFSLTLSVLLSPALIRPEGTLKMQRSRRRQHRLSSEVRCQNPPDLPSYQQRALKMCGPTFIHNA